MIYGIHVYIYYIFIMAFLAVDMAASGARIVCCYTLRYTTTDAWKINRVAKKQPMERNYHQ